MTDLAGSTDTATARWVAKVLELPTGGLALDGPAWPWLPTLVLAGLTLPGAASAAAFLRRPAARREPSAHARGYFRYIKS